jgi:hypothetical protein
MGIMKYALSVAIAATALPGAAHAAAIVGPTTVQTSSLDAGTNNSFAIAFSDTLLASPTFNETISFTTDVAGRISINVTSTTTGPEDDTDFSNVFLTGMGIGAPVSVAQILADPNETRALTNFNIGAGTFTLNLLGNPGTSSGSFGGSVAFTAVAAAVPEPGTWAMMLVGFGAIGFSMRRRRSVGALLQMA